MSASNLLRTSRSFLFFIFVMATIILSAADVNSQDLLKLYGQVINNKGPVADALVLIKESPYKAITSHDGFYYFINIPAGEYRLECVFGSITVKTTDKIIVGRGTPVRRDIFLERGFANVAPVYVEGLPPMLEERPDAIVKTYRLDHVADESLEEIIREIPGLNLVVSTATGETYISTGGIRPEGINILIDGRRLNSLLTGRADLTQLPLKAISSIEYYTPGTNSSASDGGLGGSINFVTDRGGGSEWLEASFLKGSFGEENFSAGIDYSGSSIGNINGVWEKGFNRNDYDYTSTFGQTFKRENAFIDHNKYYVSYAKDFGDFYLDFSGFIFNSENGVPGRTITPSAEALSKKETISAGGELSRRLGRAIKIGALISYLERNTEYEDYGGWIPFDTKYRERELDISFDGHYSLSNALNLSSRISYVRSRLNGFDYIRPQSALGELTRDVYKIYNGAGLYRDFGRLSITAGLSYAVTIVDNAKAENEWAEKNNYSSVSAASTCAYGRKKQIGLRLSHANSFRLPGLAELHWQEDVFVAANPDLKPEKSRSFTSELFGKVDLIGNWRISLEYRDIRYKDLIYWRRSQGIQFKPVNVSNSHYFGTTFAIIYTSPADIITIDFSRVGSSALNREEGQPYYGNYITYQPLYSNNFDIKLNYQGSYFSFGMFDTSERYFLEENTKQLDPYTLVNIKTGIKIRLKDFESLWEFRILNLTNKKYELLEYQPMPPRSYHFSMTLKL